ncbi:unnamed protein product [Arctia plantaginis]|uniref:Uncharacterized protein n=1 Tax=Arctia plantaginis TaxID=874455 RepID=A0A8S1BAW1_ARCPL|nr:unnamed protein product [Arctia plantaginis]
MPDSHFPVRYYCKVKMSHTVVRGKPTASQLYLDGVLDEVLLEKGIKPDNAQRATVTLSQLMFHCLKRNLDATFLTNGATGEIITNEQLLRHAVSLARALIADGAIGKRVMLLMRNHHRMTYVYFAAMFSGIEFFCADPNTTAYELTNVLKLIEPSYIFYDRQYDTILHEALKNANLKKPSLFIADEPQHLITFIGDNSGDIESYRVPNASPADTVMLLPTSGSTGLPKAAALSHVGMIAQLPTIWNYHTKFPTPTNLAMILTSIQWATFTMTLTTCVVYHVPVLISPRINTVESVTTLLETYRPTWTFLTPAFASSLAPVIRPDQLKSLEILILLGAPASPKLINLLQEKLPKTAQLCNGYGCTEAQGFIALPDKDTPTGVNGWVINCLHYKIVDENGKTLGPNQSGELYVKGTCIIEKYHKNDSCYKESFTSDGWYKTGDRFYVDENERITFVVRIKFSFKFQGCQVSPEEVEGVIFSVPGVLESLVCATDNGPAAAVVKRPDAKVTKEQIHKIVNGLLSDHKRLHGGIVFVPSLPHTHTGKVDRREGSKLILEAVSNGQC